jgi:hypothetical protein
VLPGRLREGDELSVAGGDKLADARHLGGEEPAERGRLHSGRMVRSVPGDFGAEAPDPSAISRTRSPDAEAAPKTSRVEQPSRDHDFI